MSIRRAEFTLVVVAFAWAVSVISMRFAPLTLLAIVAGRNLSAAASSGAIIYLRKLGKPRFDKRFFLLLAAFASTNLLFTLSLARGTLAVAFVLSQTGPLWSILFERIAFGTYPPRQIILPALGVFFGSSVLLSSSTPGQDLLSAFLGLASAVTYGLSTVLMRIEHLERPETAQSVNTGSVFGSYLITGLLLSPFLIPELQRRTPVSTIGALIVGGVIAGIAASTFGQATAKVAPTRALLIGALEAPFGIILGWLIFNQSLSGLQAAGCLLVLSCSIGVALFKSAVPARDGEKVRD